MRDDYVKKFEKESMELFITEIDHMKFNDKPIKKQEN